MKIIYFFLLLISVFSIGASDNQRMSSHFKLGEDSFDSEVEGWHKNIINNLAIAADKLKSNSDFAKLSREMKEKSLAERSQDGTVLSKAKVYFKKIENNKEIAQAFQDAYNDKTKGTEKWTTFRKVSSQQLNKFEEEAIPGIQHVEGGPTALQDFLIANEHVKLSEKQKKAFLASQLVRFSFRQIHRNCNKLTDDRNLLLDKKVTDPQ